jgi:hypothetical protein
MPTKKKKKLTRTTHYGLSGTTGIATDDKGAMVAHLTMSYGNNDKEMVFVVPDVAAFNVWERMPKKEAERRKLSPIKCTYCDKPAVRLDHSWPYVIGRTACADHLECYDAD